MCTLLSLALGKGEARRWRPQGTVGLNVLSSGRLNFEGQRGQDTYPKSHRHRVAKPCQPWDCVEGEHLAWVVAQKSWKTAYLYSIHCSNRKKKKHWLKIGRVHLWSRTSKYWNCLKGPLPFFPFTELLGPRNHPSCAFQEGVRFMGRGILLSRLQGEWLLNQRWAGILERFQKRLVTPLFELPVLSEPCWEMREGKRLGFHQTTE